MLNRSGSFVQILQIRTLGILAQLSPISRKTKAALRVETLDVVADRGYFSSEEILACDRADINVCASLLATFTNIT